MGARFENIRNVNATIDYTVLNKTRMKFSSYIDNILYCHFLNIRCGSTDNLELNGGNFSNQGFVFVVVFTTPWCMLISMTRNFWGKDGKIRPLIEINPLSNAAFRSEQR